MNTQRKYLLTILWSLLVSGGLFILYFVTVPRSMPLKEELAFRWPWLLGWIVLIPITLFLTFRDRRRTQ